MEEVSKISQEAEYNARYHCQEVRLAVLTEEDQKYQGRVFQESQLLY